MPHSPEQLFSFLDGLGIEHQTTQHPPFFTVEDGREWHDKIPGRTCKNLFLTDGKGGFWLVVMPGDKRADLTAVSKNVGTGRLSFAKPHEMQALLGVTPGTATPFALLNDTDRRIQVVLDEEMLGCELVNYHPLHNAASTSLRARDILRFVEALGYKPLITECGRTQADHDV